MTWILVRGLFDAPAFTLTSNVDVRYNNNALAELNDSVRGLLHLGLNAITFKTKCCYIKEFITFRLVWLNFCLPFSRPCSQDFLALSFSRAKEVFYASPRIFSSFQNREEPLAHFEDRFCLFWLFKRWFLKHFKMTLSKTLLQFEDSCLVYVDTKIYHLASFSTRNSTLNTSLHWLIRMRDLIQLSDSM